MAKNIPLRIYCKNCGAPVGFDIDKQTYRCSSCGEVSGIEENHEHVFQWRKLQKQDLHAQQLPPADYVECTGCGARVLFKEGEASSKCDFCGGNLVRKEFTQDKDLPELIIPFVLKPEEAQEQLRMWCKENIKKKEARRLEQHLKKIEGYYLPYRLVRGPISATVERDMLGYKTYYCRGYSEGTAVNTSSQLNNDVLDAAEPFDWSAAQPFSYAYIGGLPVKINDMSDSAINERMLEEVAVAYRPDIAKALHSDDVDIRVKAGDMINIPALLPMYIVRDNKFQAVVNGQTGRVAVMTLEKPKSAASKLWVREPLIVLGLILAGSYFYAASMPYLLFGGFLYAVVFLATFADTRNGVLIKTHHQGEATKAFRTQGKLVMEKGKDILKNAFPNTPIFYEKVDGKYVPVEISFFSTWRIFLVLVNGLVTAFLPAVIAIILCLLGVGEKSVMQLDYRYGCPWYIIGGFLLILYYVRGLRQGIFSHPILHMIMPDGKRVKVKDKAQRSIGMMSMFLDAGGYDSSGEFWKDMMHAGCLMWFMGGLFLFILLGSVMTIIYG